MQYTSLFKHLFQYWVIESIEQKAIFSLFHSLNVFFCILLKQHMEVLELSKYTSIDSARFSCRQSTV